MNSSQDVSGILGGTPPTVTVKDHSLFGASPNSGSPSSEQAEISDGLIKINDSEFSFFLSRNKNLDRSSIKNIPIGSLKTYLRASEEIKLEDKEKNFIIVEVLKRILLPISALFLILTASMLFFRHQRDSSFGSYVVGGFLGAFIFNLTQEFFFSMSLTIQSNICWLSCCNSRKAMPSR